jgi:membrane fusion protein
MSASPFLVSDPPPLAARALSLILIGLFIAITVAAFVVKMPETVAARFRLVSTKGTAQVRALHPGRVLAVHVVDAQHVALGERLFEVSSEPVGDRLAERSQLETQLAGVDERVANARRTFQSGQATADEEQRRLMARMDDLGRQIVLKERQLALAREVAERSKRAYDAGMMSYVDASKPQLDADRLAVEVEQSRADRAEVDSALSKLRLDRQTQRLALVELERSVREEGQRAQSRKAAIDADTPGDGRSGAVEAPCAGTIVNLAVTNRGAVVSEGDPLADIACDDAHLQAEVRIPQSGLALVKVGQPVRLFYDAFPYQRFGVRHATLRWISPASSAAGEGAFRSLADLQEPAGAAAGGVTALMAGMEGEASIVVGRRTLVEFVLEPMRQLKAFLADSGGAK